METYLLLGGYSSFYRFVYLFVVIQSHINKSHASKILFFNGMGEGSHYFYASSLAEELSSRGHDVTFLLGEKFKFRANNPVHKDMFNFIFVSNKGSLDKCFQHATEEAFEGKMIFLDYNFLDWYGQELSKDCEAIFSPTILEQLQWHQFDLLMCDPLWPCSIALGDYLGVEKIALMPISSSAAILTLLGNPTSSAITATFGRSYPEKMNFSQRLANFVFSHLGVWLLSLLSDSPYRHILDPFHVRSYSESLKTINVYILASDHLLDQKIPTMPGMVKASGLTIRPPKPLPKNLEDFMKSSGDSGVIIFSLGSYVTHMPKRLVKIFQEVFAGLPQKVLWQCKDVDTLPKDNMPVNVKTMTWLPQLDLLAHNKTKLLFYQGGINGVYEAIYHAVPILVMPLSADQHDIAQRIVERGIGLKIDVTQLSTALIQQRVETLIKDSKYKNTVKHLSTVFRDQPQSPRDRAAFMVEHVLRYGSDHLRSPVHDLNFLQLNLLDVYAFLIFLIICLCFILYRFCKGIIYLFARVRTVLPNGRAQVQRRQISGERLHND
ncbi:UDP-glucuronosyltransferase 1-2 [Holothuria leucospilota]|uniref:UDP-glucuronosyltransferase 1-2 n=1 Tax=Holothuria leucospilota TaxID=206669 RepID=A0A9Q1C8P0_HOLLE|nr:UDP-glucuronosyltransferase 1-2 [Holothuria leucospilota]